MVIPQCVQGPRRGLVEDGSHGARVSLQLHAIHWQTQCIGLVHCRHRQEAEKGVTGVANRCGVYENTAVESIATDVMFDCTKKIDVCNNEAFFEVSWHWNTEKAPEKKYESRKPIG